MTSTRTSGSSRGAAIQVAFADNPAVGPPLALVTVTTAAGQVTDPVQPTGNRQPLRVPDGASGWLRITVTGLPASPSTPLFGTQVGIASVIVPGVSASRTIVAPSVAGGDPSAVVLAKAQPQQSSCLLTTARWVCSPELASVTEEQYGFDQAFSEADPRRGCCAARRCSSTSRWPTRTRSPDGTSPP